MGVIELPEVSENFAQDRSECTCMATLKWRWGLAEYFFQKVEKSNKTSRSKLSLSEISKQKSLRNILKNFAQLHDNEEKSMWTPLSLPDRIHLNSKNRHSYQFFCTYLCLNQLFLL